MSSVETGPSKACSGYVIEPMRKEDLREVVAIERLSFSNPWTPASFRHEMLDNPSSHSFVVRSGPPPPGSVVGYCVMWVSFDCLHIQNVAVHPGYRRHGLGRRLMEEALARGREVGATKALLEVRESNRAARTLYVSMGFCEVGRRRRYYSRPREDAILYEKDFADAGG